MATKATTTTTAPKTSTPPASQTPPAPSRPAQATTARTSEKAPPQKAPTKAPATTSPDKVDAPQKDDHGKANTKQVENIRRNYGALDAGGDQPADTQRKVAEEQRDNIRAFNDNFKTFDGADDGGKLDGNVSRDDLQAIADGKAQADQDTREAARYFLENPDRLRALDNAAAEDKSGEGDNKIGQNDVDATLTAANKDVRTMGRTKEEIKAYDARQARLQSDSLNTLSKGYNGDITRADLQNTANDVNADKDQRDAAQYLLDNPERLNALDTAKAQGGDTDGTISEEDIKAAKIDAFNEVRKNPDAQRTEFVKNQQDKQWKTPADAVENLQKNPDLSSYSDDQLGLLNALSRNPKYQDEIQQATGNYVNQRTNSLDDIPGNMGFQGLLKTQVVDQKELDGLSPESRKIVEGAQKHLNGQVDRALSDSLDRNLDGKEGDDEADQALDGFGSDLQRLAEKNPALLDYFKSNSQKLLEDPATAEKIQDVKQADDGFFGDVTNAIGGAVTDATGWVGDKLGDAARFGFKYGPLGAPTTLLTEGAAALGWDAPKNVWDDVTTGALDRPVEALVGGVGGTLGGAIKNPTDFAKGLYTLSPLKPLVDLASGDSLGDVLKERGEVAKGLGEAFISDYKQTFEENGIAGGLAHIGSDIAVTVLTGGGSKASQALGLTGKAAKALDGAGTAFGRYDDVTTASSRLLTDDVFAKLPEKFQKDWAKELGRETLGNFQGSNIQELGKDNSKFNSDLQEQVDEALARLQSYFATQAA